MRPPLDRDFLRTREDLIFCVTGYLHPPDRVTSYLKYVPAPRGKWSDGTMRFDRAFPYYSAKNIYGTFDFLRTNYPEYLSFCPVRNMELSMVPRECMKRYYLPEERAQEIMDYQHDPLEKDARDFISLVCEQAGVPQAAMGVTGSILTRIHDPDFSDLDILVYGRRASHAVREALGRMSHPDVRRMNEYEVERWVSTRASRFPISRRLASHYCGRRWNYGYFRERYFSVHPTRTPGEVRERYGQRTYTKLGIVGARARVADASEAIFLPALYGVEEVVLKDGRDIAISAVVSHEGLYCDVAQEGDIIEVCGMLESHGEGYSIVVGTAGEDEEWIRVVGY